MRAALVLACLVVGVSASAQGTKTPAKPDSGKAPAAGTKAATKADTKADTKAGTKTDAKAPVTAPAPGAKAPAPQAGTKQAAPPPVQAPVQAAQLTPPMIMRETFAYAAESRRDPFLSLLTSDELRPTVADLRLSGILFDEGGRNSIAMMRDLTTDAMYRVRTGQIIGRMRVALIKRTVVIFSIEEFGLNRQDSLVLGDSTKVRNK